MGRQVEVDWVWKNRPVTIKANMAPAEHDVGIMSPYPDGFAVYERDGTTPINLTDAEVDEMWEDPGLQDLVVNAYYDRDQ